MSHSLPPIRCDACQSNNICFVDERDLIGSSRRDWCMIWYCHDCRATVGCHPNSDSPTGYMTADGYIKKLRHEVHKNLDRFWKGNAAISRDSLYRSLTDKLGVGIHVHIGNMSVEQLEKSLELVRKAQASDFIPVSFEPHYKQKLRSGFNRRSMRQRRNSRRSRSAYDDF